MLDLLQWPASACLLFALWLVGAAERRRRLGGYGLALAAAGFWAVWGWHVEAWALVVLSAGLVALALRGFAANRPDAGGLSDAEADARDAIRSRRPDADFARLVRDGAVPERRAGHDPHPSIAEVPALSGGSGPAPRGV